MTKIVVIGGGKIGEALISGLVNADVDPQSITVTGRRPERGEELRERYGVRDSTDNRQAAEDADVVFLCVKPKMIVDVLGEISGALEENDVTTVLVSMAGDLRRVTRPHGRLVISGILAGTHRHVLDALAPMEVERTDVLDGWACVVLRHPSSGPASSRG